MSDFEERLDDLREEAGRRGSVEGPGTRAAGGPMPAAQAGPGYYGRPIVKPPVWTWEIPLYFFTGGLAGMAAAIALAAHVAGPPEAAAALVRAALWLAFLGGAVVSPVLLVLDLGRPRRFLHMLRVFKWRSPMSVGAWILFLFGGAVTVALLLTEWAARPGAPSVVDSLRTVPIVVAGILGPALATYTGVLIGATTIPAWFAHHRDLPLHFGVSGLGSAAAALELLGFRSPALHAIGLGAASVEILLGVLIELRRQGPVDDVLREGIPGRLLRGSGLLTGPTALLLRLLGAIPWAAAAFLAGAVLGRYGWLAAGRASGRDPAATLAAQRS
ncbi:MAG: NrfD/PsrC family molybdoenzyme membrane anchor subunit [Gemmatimonadota bacterium]